MWPPGDITPRLWSCHCPVRFSCEPEHSGPWGCNWWLKCDTGVETINPSLGSVHLQVMLNVHWSILKPVSRSEASRQVFTWTWGCSSVSSLIIPSFLKRTPLWLMLEPLRVVTLQGVVQHQAPPSGLSSLIPFRRVFSLLQPLAGGVLHHLWAEAAADWPLTTKELWGRPLMDPHVLHQILLLFETLTADWTDERCLSCVSPHVSLRVEPPAKPFSTFTAAGGCLLTDATLIIAVRFPTTFSLLSGRL